MARNIVVLCDGTGNEIETDLTNVLKLFSVMRKNEEQVVFYNPGVGTLGLRQTWGALRQQTRAVFNLATAYGLDADILAAYRFLAEHWREDDRIFLFGFSRGAYTVRVVAAVINMIGLLPPAQLNLAPYALGAYKQLGETDDAGVAVERAAFDGVWRFGKIAEGRAVRVEFLGVWDTVSSVIVPRPDRFYVPSQQTLPYTRRNPCVKVFRHAMAIDERRRMFRLNRWCKGQKFVPNPFEPDTKVAQDIKQVWFPGVHGDVGGNYSEQFSGLSKFPLRWMLREAQAHGLLVHPKRVTRIVEGADPASKTVYARPDYSAPHHDSMTWAWRLLEYWPKRAKWREWGKGADFLGRYLPRCEPRVIPEGALVHVAAIEHRERVPTYRPINLHSNITVVE